MQQVDFHFNVPGRLLYACQVAKTVLVKRRLTLSYWSSNSDLLKRLDSMLWSFDDLAFLPHSFAEGEAASSAPILLSTNLSALKGDVLVLLDDSLPPNWKTEFSRFNRIIDIVGTSEQEKATSRIRYKAYRDSGVKLMAYDRKR